MMINAKKDAMDYAVICAAPFANNLTNELTPMRKTKPYKDPLPVINGLTQAIAACREALSADHWQAVIEIAQKTRTESFGDHPRVQCVMRYYEVYAMFRQQNYVVTEDLAQLVRETLYWTTIMPAPEVKEVSPPYLFYIKICFLYSILGHFAYQKQEYPLALLLLIPAYVEMKDNDYPMAGLEPKAPRTEPFFCAESLTFSRVIDLYHRFECPLDAYEVLFYAEPEMFGTPFDVSIVDEILQSQAYQSYRQTAERYIPLADDPFFAGQGTWHKKSAEVALSLNFTWQTPIQAFAERNLPFAYSVSQQQSPCVLVLQGDVDWSGDLILSEIGLLFASPDNLTPAIVLIEGNLKVEGNLLVSSPIPDLPFQLVVEGNVQAKGVFQQALLAVKGHLKAEILLLEAASITEAQQMETYICRREFDASVHGKLIQHWQPNNRKTSGEFAPLLLRGLLLSKPILENGGVLSEELLQQQFEQLVQLRQATSAKRTVIEHVCPHSLNGDLENARLCYERLWYAYQQGYPLLRK